MLFYPVISMLKLNKKTHFFCNFKVFRLAKTTNGRAIIASIQTMIIRRLSRHSISVGHLLKIAIPRKDTVSRQCMLVVKNAAQLTITHKQTAMSWSIATEKRG